MAAFSASRFVRRANCWITSTNSPNWRDASMNSIKRDVATSERSAIRSTCSCPSPNRERLVSAISRSSRLRSTAVSAPVAKSRAAEPRSSMLRLISWIVAECRDASPVSRASVPVISWVPDDNCSTAPAISWLRDWVW